MRRPIPLFAASLLAAACTSTTTTPATVTTSPLEPAAVSATLPAMPEGEPIEVTAVLDGDSLEAVVNGATEQIRLLGINTPERNECWSDQARQAAADLLAARPVTAVTMGRDQYGRLLGYVGAGGVFVNAALVASGDAMTITGNHTYLAEFQDAEQAAFEATVGMWGRAACGPDLGTGLRIDEVDGNPPGRDDDPTDGESALISNHGDAGIDLEGWVLRDESSSHRFRFPAGTRLAPGGALRVYSACGIHPHCFGEGETVWSNGGDTALLLDPSGNVVDRVRFGS